MTPQILNDLDKLDATRTKALRLKSELKQATEKSSELSVAYNRALLQEKANFWGLLSAAILFVILVGIYFYNRNDPIQLRKIASQTVVIFLMIWMFRVWRGGTQGISGLIKGSVAALAIYLMSFIPRLADKFFKGVVTGHVVFGLFLCLYIFCIVRKQILNPKK